METPVVHPPVRQPSETKPEKRHDGAKEG